MWLCYREITPSVLDVLSSYLRKLKNEFILEKKAKSRKVLLTESSIEAKRVMKAGFS